MKLDKKAVSSDKMKQRKWRKILYEDQGFPDNYTDESFLEEMKKNCKSAMFSYKEQQ